MSTLFTLAGFLDREDVMWRLGESWEANELLREHHYLGPLHSGGRMVVIGSRCGETVAAMIWKHPTSRRLPAFGTWLELARWCLTPDAGPNAGSRMHRYAVKLIREHLPNVTTLVSYSDPSHGHTGALYRACNWQWAPTWVRLRPPPSGHGDWGSGRQEIKDRWVFAVRRDDTRRDALMIDDAGAVRHWRQNATADELRWARASEHMQFVDVIPLDERTVDLDSGATEPGDSPLSVIGSNVPAEERTEHRLRVGLVPGEFHDADATGGSRVSGPVIKRLTQDTLFGEGA